MLDHALHNAKNADHPDCQNSSAEELSDEEDVRQHALHHETKFWITLCTPRTTLARQATCQIAIQLQARKERMCAWTLADSSDVEREPS